MQRFYFCYHIDMEYKWLNKKNNSKLIVFYNGWGMDENIVTHLEFDEYDVLMFYDYNSLKTDFDFSILEKYTDKYLIAWSMGVMIATLFDINYKSKTAINGTLNPIDDNFGIPTRIYNLTIKNFSSESAEKFVNNMFLKSTILPKINRKFENIKSELQALLNYQANQNFKYDRVIISSDDKIIPTKNQIAFWRMSPNIESGHSPFYSFKKWSELL